MRIGTFNLSDDEHYKKVRLIADNYLMEKRTAGDLWSETAGPDLFKSLAAYLAISKLKLSEHKEKQLRIAVLMNLVHEHNRLRVSSNENPYGENSLENKLAQLHWLFDETNIEYQLIYVSGNCPWGSDDVLKREIVRTGTDKVYHCYISDYETGKTMSANRKGGEIIFGIRSILQLEGYPDAGEYDAVLFTDADMTFDLGQAGFLISGYYAGMDLIIGNRMDTRSILIKNMTRAGEGVLMFRHIKRKLSPGYFIDLDLLDTQCPWKFLSRKLMMDIALDLDSMDWSIDTDILGAAQKHGYKIHIVPVTAIDSEYESHGKALGHFHRNRTIIEGILHQAVKYGLDYDKGMAALVEKYLRTDHDYKMLLEAGLPEEYRDLDNCEWGKSPLLALSLVEEWLKSITTNEKQAAEND